MSKSREVAEYLKQNPEFFAEHQDVLAGLSLPRLPDLPAPPDTASADEPVHARMQARQRQTQRERRDQQQESLDALVDTVRDNENLAFDLHQVAVALLNPGPDPDLGLDPAHPATAGLLVKSRFAIEHVAVFLAAERETFSGRVDYALLSRRVAHLGSVCDDRLSSKLGIALFADAAIASCAFVPLAHRGELYGVMVLGSADSRRFRIDLGVLILDRLGELIGAYLAGRGLR